MGKKIIMGSFLLIGIYLAAANATGLVKVGGAASSAANSFAKTLQGR